MGLQGRGDGEAIGEMWRTGSGHGRRRGERDGDKWQRGSGSARISRLGRRMQVERALGLGEGLGDAKNGERVPIYSMTG